MEFEIASFNRTVITDGFNRAIAGELAQHLDPTGDAKTIIFCVDDDHAERLVPILKAALEEARGPLDDDVVKKITRATDRPLDAIRRFKNEAQPKIAITVDLLSTGVDIPAVSNIVFLRRIKSRILYEQMLGRATRLCPEIGKEVFRIFDAVGLYDVLSEVSDMKPLVKDVTRTTKELVTELLDPRSIKAAGHEAGRSHADEVLREIVERLRCVVRRVGKQQRTEETQTTIDALESMLDCPLAKVPDTLHASGTAAVIQLLIEKPELLVLLDRLSFTSGPGHLAPKNKSEAMARLPRFPALFPTEIAAADASKPCDAGVPNLVAIPGAHGAHGAPSFRTRKAAVSDEKRPLSASKRGEGRRARTFNQRIKSPMLYH